MAEPHYPKTSPSHRLVLGLFKLTRPRTSVGAIFLAYVGHTGRERNMAGGFGSFAIPMLLTSFLVIGFCQVYNDIVDAPLDAIAKPNRPIPSNAVTLLQANIFAIVLVATALLLSVPTPPTAIWVILAVALGIAYSKWLKSTILVGSFIVAIVSGSPLFLSAITNGGPLAPDVLVGFVLVSAYIMGNELLKSWEDKDPDAIFGIRNLATAAGPRWTANALTLTGIVLTTTVMFASVLASVPFWFVGVAALGILLPVYASIALFWAGGLARLHAAKWWRLAWVPGMVCLLLLTLD